MGGIKYYKLAKDEEVPDEFCAVRDVGESTEYAYYVPCYKLRELVRDVCEWAYVSEYCDLDEQFADRMRELGIEVDE